MRTMNRERAGRQRGIAILEILGALAIGALMLVGLASLMDTSLEDVKGQQASYYQSQLAAAGLKYIAANGGALQAALPNAGSLVAVGVPQLIAGKFLSASTGPRNVYEQTPCLLIRQPDPGGRPGQFDALLATSGGAPIPERALALVAANAGAGGGYIGAAASGTAKGASWSTSTASFRSAACAGASALSGGAGDAGHLASNLFFDGPGQDGADFLYRNAVPGKPELNRMQVPVRMANQALVTLGASCLTASGVAEPGMAIDAATRGLAVCGAAGRWTSPSQWKEAVESYAALPASGSTSGDVRMVTGLARAFTWNGSKWAALAVDQNGDMMVPRNLQAVKLHATGYILSDGTIEAHGDIHGRANIRADHDVRAANDVRAENAVHTVDVFASNNVEAQGLSAQRWTSSPAIAIGINYFVAGQACHYLEYDPGSGTSHIAFQMGTVVMDSNYVPLICGKDKTMRYANGTYSP